MKKYQTVKSVKETEEVNEVQCDICGVKSTPIAGMAIDPYIETVQIYFGYGSRYDDNLFEIDICDDCFANTLEKHGRMYENGIPREHQEGK